MTIEDKALVRVIHPTIPSIPAFGNYKREQEKKVKDKQ